MNEKEKMLNALLKLKSAFEEVGECWTPNDDSGVTPFDEILSKDFPFEEKDPFFAFHNVEDWINNSIKEIKEL